MYLMLDFSKVTAWGGQKVCSKKDEKTGVEMTIFDILLHPASQCCNFAVSKESCYFCSPTGKIFLPYRGNKFLQQERKRRPEIDNV